MPVFTSDGNQFEDEFHHSATQVSMPVPRITVTPDTPTESDNDTWYPSDSPNSVYTDSGQYAGENYLLPELKPMTLLEPIKLKKRGAFNALTGADGKERYQTWPEKAVRSIVSGFMLPGDVASGKTDPLSTEAAGRAFELAGAMVLGPAPLASKIVDGTLGAMGGVKSITANRTNLDLAQQMTKKGMDKDKIYDATKWWQGPDKQWRYEIPDGKAQFKQSFVNEATDSIGVKDFFSEGSLGQWLKHDELFKAYPQLKDVKIQIDNELKSLGSVVSTKKGPIVSINMDKILDAKDVHPLEVILHEIQHIIQKEEGFLRGTNPNSALVEALHVLEKQAFKAAGEKTLDNWERLATLWARVSKDPELSSGSKMSEELYRRTPGELEARAVEKRARPSYKDVRPYDLVDVENPLPLRGNP